MTANMTDRDKKLLYALGFIVIIFLFILIADRPLLNEIRSANREIELEQETHDTMEMKLSRMDMVKGYRDAVSEKVSRYAERYYPAMDPAAIDDLLTGYVLGNDLKAVNLYIDMSQDPILLEPYVNSGAAQNRRDVADDQAGALDEAWVEAFTSGLSGNEQVDLEKNADTIWDTSLSGVYAATVSLTAYGNESKLRALLDQLFGDSSLRVISYTVGDIPGTGFSYVDGQIVELAETDSQLDVTLQVLMYDAGAYPEMMPREDVETQVR